MTIYLLHGFLGLPSDWNQLRWLWYLFNKDVLIEKVDLLEDPPAASLADWAREFCAKIEADIKLGYDKPVLMGYSMGGRLAMHALVHAPKLFRAGILISADPGLDSPEQKAARIKEDEEWARRFETETWSSVIGDWDSRAIFSGAMRLLERRQQDFNRKHLAMAMRNWSTGRQENLLPRLSEIPVPMLWIAGERDQKYRKILDVSSQALGLWAPAEMEVIRGAGHRVPWEQPEHLHERVEKFFQTLEISK